MDSKKILNLVTIVMFVITVVLLGLFMFGGEVPNQPYTTPVYTSTLLNWAYILCGIAIIAAIIFPVIRLFTRPKQAMKSFIGLAGVVVVILIGYALADGTPIKLVGYIHADLLRYDFVYDVFPFCSSYFSYLRNGNLQKNEIILFPSGNRDKTKEYGKENTRN